MVQPLGYAVGKVLDPLLEETSVSIARTPPAQRHPFVVVGLADRSQSTCFDAVPQGPNLLHPHLPELV